MVSGMTPITLFKSGVNGLKRMFATVQLANLLCVKESTQHARLKRMGKTRTTLRLLRLMSKKLARTASAKAAKARSLGKAAPLVAPVLQSVEDMDQWIQGTLLHLTVAYLIPATEVIMTMASGSEPVAFEGTDNSIAPYIRIPWDKAIIRSNIALIRYDHTTRMIHDSTGALRGFIYVDEESIIRWYALDGDYFE